MLIKFAVTDFVQDRMFKNLRPASISGYKYTLEQFHRFCVERDILDTDGITPAVVKSFLLYCRTEQKNNPTSINHKLRNLRTSFNYLQEIELYTSKTNPARRIDYVKADVQIQVFSEAEIRQMLNYYRRIQSREKQFYAYRDYAIIITLLGTGMRLGEMCNLRWQDIDFANNMVIVQGKMRDRRSIPMAVKLRSELLEYQAYVRSVFAEPCQNVFTNADNKRLTEEAVKNIFKRLKEVMAFKSGTRLSAHTFRHTFAVNQILAGASVFVVQRLLGHSTLDMTMRYVRIFGQRLQEQNEKFNPLNHMKID